MLRYQLRTLLVLLAILPPLLAIGWTAWLRWRRFELDRRWDEGIIVENRSLPSLPLPNEGNPSP